MSQLDSSGQLALYQDLTRFGFSLIALYGIVLDPEGNRVCSCIKGAYCRTPGKHPAGDDWALRGTRDVDRIAERYDNNHRNAGIVTGEPSCIVVLDVDPKSGGAKTLQALIARHGPLPATVIVDTGGGGEHYYFRHPGRPVSNFQRRRDLPGLDFRGDGGLVVAPGSDHTSGDRYRFRTGYSPDNVEIAALPEWLDSLLSDSRAAGGGPGSPVAVRAASHLLIRHGLYGWPEDRSYGTVINLSRCPVGEPPHDDAAHLIVYANGQIQFNCHRNRCRGKNTDDFLKALGEVVFPIPEPEPGTDEKPAIAVDTQDLAALTDEAWAALQRRNDPPRLFRFGDEMGRLEIDGSRARVQPVAEAEMRHEVALAADFTKHRPIRGGGNRIATVYPPKEIVGNMLATPSPPLPALNRIIRIPVFGRDKTLHREPGYSAGDGTFYAPAPGFFSPHPQAEPSPDDLAQAIGYVDDLLFDFPFESEADRAGAIGLFLLPYAREMIAGPTPIHLIEAPQAGTGKDLLADALVRPALGRSADALTEAGDDDEWRKRLTAALRNAPTVLQISNVNRSLDSAALAQAVTSEEWSDRLLGGNQTVSIPVRCIWIVTGNNPVMSTEIARRTTRIRLDAKLDKPWLRSEWKHGNLREWVNRNRTQLVWSGLTMIQHWIVTGAEPAARPFGAAQEWAGVIGGILRAAGIPGFLDNLTEFYERADIEGNAWRALIDLWWLHYGDEEIRAGDLFNLALDAGLDGFDFKGSDRSQRIQFGKALGRQRDRVYGDFRVTSPRERHKQSLWQLVRLSGPEIAAEKADRERRREETGKVSRLDRVMGTG